LVYWVTSNTFSLIQAQILRQPQIRTLVGIPTLIKHSEATTPAKEEPSFMDGIRFGAAVGQKSDPYVKRSSTDRPLPSLIEASNSPTLVESRFEPRLTKDRFIPKSTKEALAVGQFRVEASRHQSFLREEQRERDRQANELFIKAFESVNKKRWTGQGKRTYSTLVERTRPVDPVTISNIQASTLEIRLVAWRARQIRERHLLLAQRTVTQFPEATQVGEIEAVIRQALQAEEATSEEIAGAITQVRKIWLDEIGKKNAVTSLGKFHLSQGMF